MNIKELKAVVDTVYGLNPDAEVINLKINTEKGEHGEASVVESKRLTFCFIRESDPVGLVIA